MSERGRLGSMLLREHRALERTLPADSPRLKPTLPAVRDQPGALQVYEPEHGLKSIAAAEVAAKHWRRIWHNNSDPFAREQLEKAIDAKIDEQVAYIVWRDGGGGRGRHGGDRKSGQVSDLKVDLPDADPGDVAAHRWRKKFCSKVDGRWQRDETKTAAVKQEVKHRCIRTCEQEKDRTVRGTEGTGEFERYTPAKHIEAVRVVLGEIDLDPATCELAQETVQATNYFTLEDDGLEQEWHGDVFLNPPYHENLLPQFINKLVEEIEAGRTTSAILLVNNCTDTEWFDTAVRRCNGICFTQRRIEFFKPDGNKHAVVPMGTPTQGQAFLYYGPNVQLFEDVFCSIGNCFPPPSREYHAPSGGVS